MQKLIIILTILVLAISTANAEYKLVWSEDFDSNTIGETWQRESNPGVMYNAHEKQFYTDRKQNSDVKDGNLIIRADKEFYEISDYTSGRVNTLGKYDVLYGKIEARIKTASADGIRCKMFMLPKEIVYGTWAMSGQIDVFETVGANPNNVRGGIYHGGQGHANIYSSGEYAGSEDLSQDYHIYTVEWQPYEMRWFIDGQLYAMQNQWSSFTADYPAPFDNSFYLGFGIAIDGTPNDEQFPAEMKVDWVKVYQVEGDNTPPKIEIIAPVTGTSYLVNTVDVIVEASDADGNLDKVEFYNHNQLVGTVGTAPYKFTFNATDGCHKLIARAVDSDGFGYSDSVEFVTGQGCPPQPYHGSPISLPGRLEVEDFDTSPKENAYYDTDASNNGGAYRETGVDIQDCIEGGYNLAWIEDNEWTEYTVNIEKAGLYDIVCRTGSPYDTGKLHVEFDGVDKTGTMVVVNTGDWQNYTNLIKKNVELKAGVQTMKLFIEQGGFNLNFIEVNASIE